MLKNKIEVSLFSFYFILLIINQTSYSQEPIYQHFGVDEGLPSSQIYDICQTKNGHIWFATDKGISRYNGYEFENFDTSDGLPGNVVLRFYPLENGEIWGYCNNSRALFYFNEKFSGFKLYKHNNIMAKELKIKAIVKSVSIDKFKTIYLGGDNINGELLIKNNGTIERKYTNKNFYDSITPHKHIVLNKNFKNGDSYFLTLGKNTIEKNFSTIQQKKNHHQAVYLIPNKKAVFMDGVSVKIINSDKTVIAIKNSGEPLRLKVIDSTRFFVGYHYGGAKIINNKGDVKQEYLKDKSVTNFLIDNEGGYWFTTLNSGVYYVKKPSIIFLQPQNTNVSLHINSLVKKNNQLLIGYYNGDFAELQVNKSFNFKKAKLIFPPAIVEYDSIFDKTYTIFNNQLLINKKLSVEFYALKISEPTLNGTVFESYSSGFYEISKQKDFFLDKRILDVSLWKKDTLLATHSGIFKKMKGRLVALSAESKLLGFRSDDIDVTSDGNVLFIATQGAGVVVYGEKIYNITTKEGLTSDIVNEIYIENDNTILACTNKGLNRIVFNNKGFSITYIDKNSGLLSNEVEDVEVINDTLFVATKDGLCYMPKSILDAKKSDSIYLKIKEVKINDVIYTYSEYPKLNYTENKITFFVEGISFGNNSNLEYHYRLKEIDNKWSVTKNRTISFPNLKHGNYTFQIRACLGSKCYSEEQLEYPFIIKPPFWVSWWFYTLCFLVFSGFIYLFFKIRVLTYNKDIIREFIRLIIQKLKNGETYIEIRMNGEDVKILTKEICYIKSSGNYLDIITLDKSYTIRCKIGDFITTTPDAFEYLRVHRFYIIRIDKVTSKSKNTVTIKEHIIPVGETYLKQLDHIQF
ncbi:ligand-binding sensor domain-containing protein [Polaribacter glomeratus]|uniref:ligand-binding sensor domain-containing protein n=1 Tax=Polaribacter glomeratus TaxID=102 RepID=UPI0014785C71|nr:triple tyrosine motif-containing protein [Polaribacter glomeratus]